MTAWTRSRSPSLARRLPTWVLTVASLTNRAVAISALLRPRASNRTTSRSRAVSEASRDGDGAASGGRRAGGGGGARGRRAGEARERGAGPRGGQERAPGARGPDRGDQVVPRRI